MNELFWPSQTSEASGGSLVGTMSADRASGPQMPATYEQVLPVQSQEPQAAPDVAGLSRVQAQGLAQDGQQATFFNKLSFNQKTGEVNVSLDQSALAEVMGQLTDLKQMKAAAMARVAQLKQQEASGSPLLDALSTFAGNMAANDPKMPGWIRALGQTSLQMGPQGIRAKREAEEQKALQLTKLTADTALDAAKLEDQKYKMTVSLIEKARADAEKADKDLRAFAMQIRKEGRAQIERTGGVYDREGFVAEMREAGLPDEVIEAQVASLENYAEAWKEEVARRESIKDAAELRKRDNEWRKMQVMQDKSDARTLLLADSRQAAFQFKNETPVAKDLDILSNSSQLMHYLQEARDFVGEKKSKFKGGPIAGWIAEKNPWRDPEFQAAFMDSHNITLAALKASGLAPISELEFENQAKRVFSPKLTWDQNMEALEKLEAMTLKAVSDHIQMQPQRNWNVAVGVIPKKLHGILPKMEERRMELYGRFAPQGVTPRGEATAPPPAMPRARNAKGEEVEWDGEAWRPVKR
jgi:hypothetical protein